MQLRYTGETNGSVVNWNKSTRLEETIKITNAQVSIPSIESKPERAASLFPSHRR